ncbi:hypothetical protein GCM10009304_39030 [Pseudomonas matsuisoli]|uniref:Cadherin domain-containing protein n=1 Tax=Pseudomonas matsuisoli TaxID=1515666 RepID=A0A917Q2M6_9PSED|nr:hypothetical protein GCM10009304_39030 [Pseudomonas matsuisoli]
MKPTLTGLSEDVPVTFSSALGTQLRVTDDGATGTVTLSVPHGTLALNANILAELLSGLLSGTSQTGNGTNSITLTGQLSIINNALNGLVYTPTADANGPVNLTVTANDGIASAVTTVVPMNFAAVADIVPDTATAYLNTASSFNVLANDNFENAGRVVTGFTQPANGSVTIDTQGNAVYTPKTGWTGTDTFTYTVTSGGATETATVTMTTVIPNYAPTIGAPATQTFIEDAVRVFSTANGNAITVNDANGDNLSVTLNTANGTLLLAQTAGLTVSGNGTGSVTLSGSISNLNNALNGLAFTPVADYNGAASISVTASDGQAAVQTTTIGMTITPVADGVADSISTGPLRPVTFNPLANDNFENANATVTAVSQGANGVVLLGLGNTITYTPALGFVGNDTFTYTVTSGGVTEQVSVSVLVGNTTPVSTALGTLNTVDKGPVLILAGLSFYDPDGLLDVLRFSATGLPAGLSIDPITGTIGGIVDGHASVNGTNGTGTYNVVVTATDLAGASVNSTLTVNVSNPPPIPILGLQLTTDAAEDTLLNLSLSALLIIDPDGDAFSITQASAANGTVTIRPDGSLDYQPNPNFNGIDTITYTVRDVDGGQAVGTALVVVLPVADLPIINLPALPLLQEDTPLIFANILGQQLSIGNIDGGLVELAINVPIGNISIVETGGVTIAESTDANGQQIVNLRGTVADINVALGRMIYTPAADYNGPVNITLNLGQLTGGLLNVNASLPIITIGAVADIADDNVRVVLDTPVQFNVMANDTFENPNAAVTSWTQPAHGTVRYDGNGLFTYTPNAGWTGTDTFTYTVLANEKASIPTETATVTLTTALPNYAPTIVTQAPALTFAEDTPQVFSTANGNAIVVADGNNDTLTVTLTANHGALTLAQTTGLTLIDGNGADGTLTVRGSAADINAALNGLRFTPTADYNGPATLSVTASDSIATVQNAAVTMTITPVADGVADSIVTEPLVPITFYPLANDNFEGNAVITSIGAAAHGTVLLLGNAVTYTPVLGYRGADSFTYTVTSGGVTETITVNVTVGTNHAPVGSNLGTLSTVDAGLVTVAAGLSFADVDLFDKLTFSASNLPAGLTIDPNTGLISGIVGGHASQVNGGVYNVVITARDLAGATATSTLTVTVANPPPIAGLNVAISLNEDTTFTVPRDSLAIVDLDGDAVTVTGASAQHGTVVIEADGSLTYTPKPNFNGIDAITYTVRDADGGTDVGVVAVTVLPVLDLPKIELLPLPVFYEDTPILMVSALGQALSVGDIDGKLLDLTLNTPVGSLNLSQDSNVSIIANANGTLRLQGSAADINAALGALVYTPGADYNGLVNISVQLAQLTGILGTSIDLSSLVTLNLPITIVPVADVVNDEANVTLDTPVTLNVLANDNFENAGREVISITQPAHGSATFQADGTVTYTPNAGYTGNDSFTYTVRSNGTLETATVTLHVALPNYAPTVNAPASQTFAEDTPLVFSDANGNALTVADQNNDALTVTLSTNHGALALAQTAGLELIDGNGADGSLVIRGTAAAINAALNGLVLTPSADYYGPAALNISANDGALTQSTSIGLTITPVADGVTDSIQTSSSNVTGVTFYPLANDSFEAAPVITGVSDPAHGTVTRVGNALTYFPTLGYTGSDSFTYTVTSGGVTEVVTVNVTVGNQAPTTVGGLLPVLTEDGAIVVNVATGLAFRDADLLDVLRFSASNLPAGLSIDPLTGIIAGKVDGHASTVNGGVYTVTVTATDLAGASVSTTLSISVSNPAPVGGINIAVTGNEDTALTIPNATLAIFDRDNDVVTVTGASAGNGTVSVDANGNLIYTPRANFNGIDTITYTLRDADGATGSGTVVVTVLPVLDLPTLQIPTLPVFTEDTPILLVSALGQSLSVGDVDGKLLDLVLTAPRGSFSVGLDSSIAVVANAGASLHLQGTPADVNAALAALVYTPGADYNGPLNITLQLGQLTGILGSQLNLSSLVNLSLPITIAPVADIVDDNVRTTLEAPVSFNVLANDTFENAGRIVTAVGTPAHGSVTFDAQGNLVYTPNAGYLGTDSFTYTVTSNGTVETATVTVTTALPNYAPVVSVPGAAVVANEDSTLVFSTANGNAIAVADANGDVLTVTVQTDRGTLSLAQTTGLTLLTGDGVDDSVLIVRGSATDINAALNGLTFKPTADYNGSASIQVQAFDGVAAPQSATVAISLTPVADGRTDLLTTEPLIPATLYPLANDTFSNPNATITAVTNGAHGTVVIGLNNAVTYLPGAGYRGADSFTYTVTSGGVTETITVNVVVGTNQPPIGTDMLPRVSQDGAPIAIVASAAFVDSDLFDRLTYSATGLPAGLSIDATTGVISGTLDGHASQLAPNGNYTIVITATDLAGAKATSTLQMHVDNPAPIAGLNVAVTVNEDTSLTIPRATLNIVDPDRDVVTVTGATALHGTVSVAADGSLIYTPNANYNGVDVITYLVRDADGATATGAVAVTVLPVLDLPTIKIPTIPVFYEDTPLVFADILGQKLSVGDIDGKLLDLTINTPVGGFSLSQPSNVTIVANANGSLHLQGSVTDINAALALLVYTPGPDYNGPVQLSLQLGQLTGLLGSTLDINSLVTVALPLTIEPVADVVNDQVAVTAGIPANFNVLANDTFENAGRLLITHSEPANGTVTIDSYGNARYTPNAGFTGTDSFTYTVESNGTYETGTVTLTVTLPNYAPTVSAPAALTVAEDTPLAFAGVNAISVADINGDRLTVTLLVNHGTLTLGQTTGLTITTGDGTADALMVISGSATDINAALAGMTFAPTADYNGGATLNVQVSDGIAPVQITSVLLTVTPVADGVADSISTGPLAPYSFYPLANDTFENANAAITSVSAAAHGTVVLGLNGQVTYTPALGYVGADSFTYTVTSGGVTETVTVNVTVGNQAPTTTGNLGSLNVNDADIVLAVSTAQAFRDADALDTLRFSATGLPAGLTIDPATGFISGTVNGHASVNGANGGGQYTVTVTATDRAGASVSTTMVINVSNPAPLTGPTVVIGNEDTPIAISAALLNVRDPDGDSVTITGATAANGSVTINANGSLTYTPNPNYNGIDTITYSVRDADGAVATGTVVVTVLPVVDLPTITLPTIPVFAEDTPLVFADILGQGLSVGDVDGEVLDLKLSVPVGSFALNQTAGLNITENTGGTLRIEGSVAAINAALGGLVYTPGADYNGPLNITVQLGQLIGGVLNVSTVLPIEIAPVADIVDDQVRVVQNTPTGFNVLTNDNFENPARAVTALGEVTALGNGNYLTANGGTVTFNANGQVFYTPANGFTGTDRFTYTVTSNGTTETATVTLIVAEPNYAPTVVAPALVAGSEDNPIVLSGANAITVGDANAADTLTVTLSVNHGTLNLAGTAGLTVVSGANGSASVTVSGSAAALNAALNGLTFTPVADYNGNALIQVQVSDGVAAPINASVALSLAAVADGVADSITTDPLVPVTFSPLANDTFNNANATVTAVTNGANGSVVIGANNALTYLPNVGFRGVDSFTYTVTSGGVTETIVVTVNVGTNQAPVAGSLLPVNATDSAEVLVPAALAFADSDLYDRLTYTATNLPAGLSIDPATGVITGTLGSSASAGGTNGTYNVVVTATDLAGASASSTLQIHVTNPAPVAGATVAVGVEDTPLTIPRADLAISDIDGDDVTVIEAVAGRGSVVIGADGSLTYTPAANFNGVDTITFTVRDADGATAIGTVVVTVAPVLDLPTLQIPSIPVFAEDTPLIFANVLGQTLAVGDVDGKVLDLTLNAPNGSFTFSQGTNVTVVSNVNGVLHLQGSAADINAALGVLVYTPGADYNGNLQISLQLNQLVGAVGSAIDGTTLVSSVLPLTIAPVADIVDDHVSIVGDVPVALNVLANDSFENAGRLVTSMGGVTIDANGNGSFTTANGGSVTFSANGALIYTPRAGFIGDDSFTYTVTSNGTTETATVTITVNPVPNTDPVAEPIANQTARDGQTISLDVVQAAFSDADNDTLSFSASGLPAGLTMDPATGLITGTLGGHASTVVAGGSYTVTVTARDGNGGEVSQSFTLTVSNPAPIAEADSFEVDRNTLLNGGNVLTGNVLGNDRDPDGDALTVQVTPVQGPSHGVLALRADGSFTYTPALNYSGTDTFTYRVVDADGGSAIAVVTITVNAENEAPVAQGTIGPRTGTDNLPFTLSTAGRFTDIDGDTLSYSATGLPAGLTIDATTGLISGTVDSHASVNGIGRTGVYSVTVTADDGRGGLATQTFTLTIANPAPVTDGGLPIVTPEDTAYAGRLVATDADNDALTFTVTQAPAHGTLLLNTDGTYTYTPAADYNGPDSFSYRVTDADGGTAVATVNFNVTPVNDAPTPLGAIANQNGTDGAAFTLNTAGNFTDVDNPQLVYSSSPLPAGLTINPVTGVISGTLGSSASALGPYTITVYASDGLATASQSFVLTVTNPAPTSQGGAYSIAEDGVLTGTLTATDTDGDTLTFAVATGPEHGTLVLNANGAFVYEPFADYNGPDRFTYTVTDVDGASVTATVTLTVTPVNDGPDAVGSIAPQRSTDGSGFSLDVSGNFRDVDNDALSYSASGLPAGLTINAATGVISGTIGGHASTQVIGGVYTVVVTAKDPSNATITSSFTFVVSNPPPTANTATFDLSEDGTLTASLTATDPDNDALTFSTTVPPLHGTLVLNDNGTFTYTPNADYHGPDQFTYQVRDADGGFSLATVTLNIAAVNDAPLPNGTIPTQSGTDGQPFSLNIGGNFRDPDGDALIYTVDELPAGLTLVNGVISGSLDRNASVNGDNGTGVYTITVTATDASGAAATQTFVLIVSNPAPVTPGASLTVMEDNAFNGRLTATDPDGDTFEFALADNGAPANGTVVLNADGTFTYRPNANYHGADSFSYTVTDSDGGVATATVNITVTSVNDAPVTNGSIAAQIGTDGASFTLSVAGRFVDADNDVLTYSAAGLPLGLSIDPATGLISGDVNGHASVLMPNGRYTVVVTANDGNGGTATQTFILTVANPAPTTAGGSYSVAEDGVLSATLTAQDVDGDSFAFSAETQPAHGTVVMLPNGSFVYTPSPNYNGPDSFTYRVTDTDGGTVTATVLLNVTPVNDAPTPNGTIAPQRGTDGVGFNLDVKGNFADIDNDALTYTVNGLPAGLDIVNGVITGTVDNRASTGAAGGVYNVTVTATDPNGASTTQTFTLTIANPAPTTADRSYTFVEDTTIGGTLLATDPDGDTLTFSTTVPPLHGTLVLNASGSFTYTPNTDYNGTDSFSYQVRDADGGIATATVTLNITAVNDAPQAVGAVAAQTGTDNLPFRLDVAGNFTDVDNATLSYRADGLPAGLSIDAAGVISGTVDHRASVNGLNGGGVYTVTITATDTAGDSTTQAFTLTINNPAPITLGSALTATAGTPATGTLTAIDPDGDTFTFAAATGPAHGSVTVNADGSYTYTADLGYTGTDSFTYTVTDIDGGATTATVAILVNPAANDGPVTTGPIGARTADDGAAFTLDVSGNFTDPDGQALTYRADNLPAGLQIDSSTGIISGTLDGRASTQAVGGIYNVTVTATDASGASVSQVFLFTATNPAPTTTATPFTVAEDGTYTGTLVATDIDRDALTFSTAVAPLHGTLVLNANGSFTYQPNANYNGADSFTYEVRDADGGLAFATVNITVTAVNDAPTPAGTIATQTGTDGQPFVLNVAGNFTDVDNPTLSYSAVGLPNGLTINSAGVITGTVDSHASVNGENRTGTYTVTVIATDASGAAATQTFTFTVANTTPVASNGVLVTNEDTPASGQLVAVDADRDALSYSLQAGPSSGSVVVNTDGSYTYTPSPNYNGPDSFTYIVRDGDGGEAIATVNILVTAVNDAPTRVGSIATQTGTDGQPFSLGVAGNFADIDGDRLSFSATGLPTGLVINPATGAITGSFGSSDSARAPYTVVVTATDPSGASITQSFTLNVLNTQPVSANASYTLAEDSTITRTLAATDADGDTLTFRLAPGGQPAHGLLQLGTDGRFTYTPNSNYNGTDTFTYTVTDADGASVTATVTLNITPVNDGPVAVGSVAPQTGSDGAAFNLNVAANFSDIDGDTLAYSVSGLPRGLEISPQGVISGTLDGHASQLAVGGLYTVTVTATDPSGAKVSQSFVLSVTNPAPTTEGGAFTAVEDGSLTRTLVATDVDGDALTFVLVTGAEHGTLSLGADGTFTYRPNPDYTGPDRFTYEVRDTDGGIVRATVELTVTAVPNEVPVPSSTIATQSATDGKPFSLNVGGSFTDRDNDTLTYSASNLPNGLSITPAGVIQGTVDSHASAVNGGRYEVTVTVDDGKGGTASQTFVLNVVNTVPVAAGATLTTAEDRPFNGQLVATDEDGDSLTYSAVRQPANGNLVIRADGSFTYTPAADFNGSDSFTYRVVDGDGGVSTATVTFVVTPANDVPVITTPIATQSGTDGATFNLNVSGNFRDIDGDRLSYSATGLPAGLSIDRNTGLITGTLGSSASATAPYTITVTATDPSGASVGQTFALDVSNPAPTTSDSSFSVSLNGRYTGLLQASDVDGDALSFGLIQSAGPSHGVLTLNADGTFVYAPFNGYSGADSFTYSVRDADGGLATAIVTINVSTVPNNGPIVSQPIAGQRADDGATYRLDVGAAFRDADGDRLTYSASNLPAGLSIDPFTGVISGTVDTHASQGGVRGVYEVTIIASDGQQSVGQVVTFTIANPAPQTAGGNFVLNEDSVLTGALQASDPDGDALTFSLAANGGPAHGTLVLNADGTFVYRPDANYNGPDRFTYVVRDADGGLTQATVTLNVAAVNDAPVAGPNSTSTNAATPVTIDVLANATDADGDTLTVIGVRADNGTVVINTDGTLTYTPRPGFTGVDTINYVLSDGTTQVTANATVTVRPLDVPPTVPSDANVTPTVLQGQPGIPPSTDDGGLGQYLRNANYDPVLLDAINGVKRLDGVANFSTNNPMLNVANGMQRLNDGQEILPTDAPMARAIGDLQEINRQPLDADQLVPMTERTPVSPSPAEVEQSVEDTSIPTERLEDAPQATTTTNEAPSQQGERAPLTLQEQLLEASRKRDADREALARLLRD